MPLVAEDRIRASVLLTAPDCVPSKSDNTIY